MSAYFMAPKSIGNSGVVFDPQEESPPNIETLADGYIQFDYDPATCLTDGEFTRPYGVRVMGVSGGETGETITISHTGAPEVFLSTPLLVISGTPIVWKKFVFPATVFASYTASISDGLNTWLNEYTEPEAT